MAENFVIMGLLFLSICLVGYIAIHKGREIFCKDKCQNDGENCKAMMAKDFIYMAAIFAIVLIIVTSFALYRDNTAIAYLSFAGTVTSIILSVIAIIMTLNSERKSESAKSQLDLAIKTMKETNEDLTGKVEQIKFYSDELEQKLVDKIDKILLYVMPREEKGNVTIPSNKGVVINGKEVRDER